MDKRVEVIHLRLPPRLKELIESHARKHVQSINSACLELLSLGVHLKGFDVEQYCNDKFNPDFFDSEAPSGHKSRKK